MSRGATALAGGAKPGTAVSSGTMRAAVLRAPGMMETRRGNLPEPGANEVRVRLEGCGVCASNLPPWEGREWFKYPMTPGQLGHEGWGRIDAIGRDVRQFEVGQRVAFLSNNAYAEYDVAGEGQVVALPASLDDQPFPAEPLGCAMNIFKRSEIKRNDTVAIIGIGFLGALLTQLASAAGAHVIAITRRPFALQFATAAEKIVMDDHARIVAEVNQISGGKFCDVVIECTGKQWPLDLAAELT